MDQIEPIAFRSSCGVRGLRNVTKAELNCSRICAAAQLIHPNDRMNIMIYFFAIIHGSASYNYPIYLDQQTKS